MWTTFGLLSGLVGFAAVMAGCFGGGPAAPVAVPPAPGPPSQPAAPLGGGGSGTAGPLLECQGEAPAPDSVVDSGVPTVSVTLSNYPVGPGPYMRIGTAMAGTTWDPQTGLFSFVPTSPLTEGDNFVAVEWAGHTCSWRFTVRTQTATLDGAGLVVPQGSTAQDDFVSSQVLVRFREDPHPGYAGNAANWQVLGNPVRQVVAALVEQGQDRWYTLTLDAGIQHFSVGGYMLQYTGPGGPAILPLGGGGGMGAGGGGGSGPGPGGGAPAPMSLGGGGAPAGATCFDATHTLLMDVLADESEDNWMVDAFSGTTGPMCGGFFPSCGYWLENAPTWNVYRKSRNILWPASGPLTSDVTEEINHIGAPWTEVIPPGAYQIMKGWIHTSDISWPRALTARDVCAGLTQEVAGQEAANDITVQQIDLAGNATGGAGGGAHPSILDAQILKGSDLPGPLAAKVCDPGQNGGTPVPPLSGVLDDDACRYHPAHYYYVVEATDDFELWPEAFWWAFDKEYWEDPAMQARLQELNSLLEACANPNWDNLVRGCLLSIYQNDLTAEERLNVCYWGDATVAEWQDDTPLAPAEPTTSIPSPVAGWADPVSIAHDKWDETEHGWWVVAIPAPLCCKSSWYMTIRDKAGNWRRAEPVDLPPILTPAVTTDQQTNVTTIRFWGYPLPGEPATQGGYAADSPKGEEALRVTGRTFDTVFGGKRQYINIGAGEDLSGPGWPDAPQTEERGRRLLFGVQGSARKAFAVALDHPYDETAVGLGSTATNPSWCIQRMAKNDMSGWRSRPGDNARQMTCDQVGGPSEEGCFLEQDPADNPTVRKPAAECFKTTFHAEIGGISLWSNEDPSQWHTLGFEVSTFASDNYKLALCACDMATLDEFVADYYESGPKEPEDESIKLGEEIQVWRMYWLWDLFIDGNEIARGATAEAYDDAYMEMNWYSPIVALDSIYGDGSYTLQYDFPPQCFTPGQVDDPGWTNERPHPEDVPPECWGLLQRIFNHCDRLSMPPTDYDWRYAHSQHDINEDWGHLRNPLHRIYAHHGDAQVAPAVKGWVCPDNGAPDNHLFLNWAGYERSPWTQVYAHEVGHVMGLDHPGEGGCDPAMQDPDASFMEESQGCDVFYLSLSEVGALRRAPGWL